METDEKDLMLTVAWLFARHGQRKRARTILECVVEEDPSNGIAAAVLADLMLADGEAQEALHILRNAEFPAGMKRAEAMLETRALKALGRADEAVSRWRRFVKSSKGDEREWF